MNEKLLVETLKRATEDLETLIIVLERDIHQHDEVKKAHDLVSSHIEQYYQVMEGK